MHVSINWNYISIFFLLEALADLIASKHENSVVIYLCRSRFVLQFSCTFCTFSVLLTEKAVFCSNNKSLQNMLIKYCYSIQIFFL